MVKAEERCCTEFREELRLRDSEGHGGVDICWDIQSRVAKQTGH